MKTVSILLPVYNEEETLAELYKKLKEVTQNLASYQFELIFIDDGSQDNSKTIITELHEKDSNVKLLSLSRNFGHQLAITAGLDYASGEAVIIMDADLQHPPALIPAMLEKWEEGFEVVNTQRLETEDATFFKNVSSRLFYMLFNKLTTLTLQPNTADFRLMNQQTVQSFRLIREQSRFLRGLINWMGFNQIVLPYTAPPRFAGKSKYTFRKMLTLALNGIVSFSSFPLHIVTCLGIFISSLSMVYAFYAIYIKVFTGTAVPGWASVLVMILFLGGCQLITLGIIGEYIRRIYDEVKNRPLYLLQETVGLKNHESQKIREQLP